MLWRENNAGHLSDIRPAVISDNMDDTTFLFTVPERDLIGHAPDSQANVSLHLEDDEEVATEETEDEVEQDLQPQTGDDQAARWVSGGASPNATSDNRRSVARQRRKINVSKHGLQYPSLPAGVVRKLATTFTRTSSNNKAKISRDTLAAIMQASEWFFEQVSDDLGAYAEHAHRRTIDESDVITLMQRYAVSVPLRCAIINTD